MSWYRMDLTGQKYGRLLVLHPDPDHARRWICRCDCGTVKSFYTSNIRSGYTTSCGCFQKEHAGEQARTHGHAAHGKRSPEFQTWVNMKSRCLNPAQTGYEYYGERGIKICDRWLHSFENFFADMGPKPSPKHTIERKDTNGDYEPTNCIWATYTEQNRNRRVTVKIEGVPVTAIAEKMGVNAATLRSRRDRGWNDSDTITRPIVSRSSRHLKTGQRFGALVVVKKTPPPSEHERHFYWLCRCDCGTEKILRGSRLITGEYTACSRRCLQAGSSTRDD